MDDDEPEPDSKELIFKPISLEDKDFLSQLLKNPHIAQNFIKGSEYVDSEINDILDAMLNFWVNNQLGFYVVYQHTTPIGLAGFSYLSDYDEVEVVYCVDQKYWGQGLASEILKDLLVIGLKQFNLSKLMGIVKIQNQASYKVLVKNNFKFVKEFEEKNQKFILLELHNQQGQKKKYLKAKEIGL
jgi:ribosomal-protein-alanine N-acetyltransferase